MTLQKPLVTTRRMIRTASIAPMISLVVLGSAITASAQQASRGFITINGGYQATSTDFTDNIVFTQFAEEGDFDADYGLGAGPLLDVGGGARVWQDLAVGVGVSLFSKGDAAGVTARIPHPFFFDRDRQISGSEADLARDETAVHLQVMWMTSVNEALEVAVFGGPSYFDVKQDLVTEVTFSQTYPFDTAEYAGSSSGRQSESTIGFNVGADVAYYFSSNVGVGWLARFSRATLDLPSEDGGTISVDAGGFQTGAGLRFRF